MKKTALLFFIILFSWSHHLLAQAPLKINYQGVARNNFGTTINNKAISLRLSIKDGSAGGPTVYSETHNVNTDQYGVFALQIGGGTVVSGTMASINWALNTKFLQAEMDPQGGTSFSVMGVSQLVSVPFSIISGGAPPIGPAGGDLAGSTYPNPTIAPLAVTTSKIADGAVTSQKITVPLVKNQADVSSLINMTNTSATNGSTGIAGNTNGNGPSSFGVVGTANNGGFGVAGYSNAISVLGVATAATGQAGRFETFNAANTTPTVGAWNGAGSGAAIDAINLGTGTAGTFTVNNPASTADALRAVTNGIGASWAIRATSTGTNGAGLFISNNATATNNNLQSNTNGLGRAGLFNSNNAAAASNAVDINVAGTGFALRAASSNAAPRALQTVGAIQLTGIGEAANKVLVSDAAGNATWQTASGAGVISGSGTTNFISKFTPSGTAIGNSMLFDDGISLGMGTITPTHRLTVSHAGSTGIGISSTSGFSVMDINAASGDAALRFGNAGVNQWNVRNEPATNNLQVFELGGGGSRFTIQDATGNVGIGPSLAPSYKLDVEHGGSTGIRSKSTSSFSVVDIDAQSGDAALRFQRAGVNQWNTRNRPADDYYEIFELGGGGSRFVIQDGTGNVGIGETTSPSYKLDVLHVGSTGIRSRSSSSFSVVDIDAQSGDAALRFQKAGVNQWNLRNRPGDDYFEIFELGGGGSRVVIQDATGNVGIGETTAPSYKLDVLHGGSTGIRSRSSSSFSVVDIDAQSGDAALRFQKAGVNQWNIRNNPGTDDLQIFELGGGGERMRIENTTGKVVVNGDFTAIGVKAFTMDHPLDPANKILRHAAAESNEVINFYSGNVTTNASGKAIVTLPDYFEAINKDYRYQLTVIGSFAQAIINKEVANNQFEIATSLPNIKVSWEVKGVRNDARMQRNAFMSVEEKALTEKGKYIDPVSHKQPLSKQIGYDASVESSLTHKAKETPAAKNTENSVSSVADVKAVTVTKTVVEPKESSVNSTNAEKATKAVKLPASTEKSSID
jgi:hypothetical protein